MFGQLGTKGELGGLVGAGVNWLKGLIKFETGGVLTEPVFGFGLHSGRPYTFAEKEPERIQPVSKSGAITINNQITVVAPTDGQIAPEALSQIQARVGAATMRALRRLG